MILLFFYTLLCGHNELTDVIYWAFFKENVPAEKKKEKKILYNGSHGNKKSSPINSLSARRM